VLVLDLSRYRPDAAAGGIRKTPFSNSGRHTANDTADRTASASAQTKKRTEENHSFMRSVRRATHRKYTPEEKNPIGVEGFHREITVNDLCRREGINPANYYSWTKEFMEAGKERLTRKTVLDATRHEN
jgi:transposase